MSDDPPQIDDGRQDQPWPEGIGVDIEDVARWRDPKRPLTRLFTPAELERAARLADPAPTYAGLWCAREAAFKALDRHVAGLTVRRLSVVYDEAGRPSMTSDDECFRPLAERLLLSISHTRTTAIAVAVLGAEPG